MRPLIIDDQTKEKLAAIKAYAEAHVYEMLDLVKVTNEVTLPPGDNPAHVANIEIGYRVVFSIENQTRAGKVRHLSVSVNHPGNLPNLYACAEFMRHLGFENELLDSRGGINPALTVRLEETPTGQAVNILEITVGAYTAKWEDLNILYDLRSNIRHARTGNSTGMRPTTHQGRACHSARRYAWTKG